jgi:hypothetical protein
MRGPYGMGTVNAGLEELEKWFAGQDAWEPVGDPRGLNYNGPQVRTRDKWSEVQVQVQPKSKGGQPSAAPAAPAAPAPASPETPKN